MLAEGRPILADVFVRSAPWFEQRGFTVLGGREVVDGEPHVRVRYEPVRPAAAGARPRWTALRSGVGGAVSRVRAAARFARLERRWRPTGTRPREGWRSCRGCAGCCSARRLRWCCWSCRWRPRSRTR
ncbi:hypothetical protein ACU686_32115 [Yinghuangia aomiensis]